MWALGYNGKTHMIQTLRELIFWWARQELSGTEQLNIKSWSLSGRNEQENDTQNRGWGLFRQGGEERPLRDARSAETCRITRTVWRAGGNVARQKNRACKGPRAEKTRVNGVWGGAVCSRKQGSENQGLTGKGPGTYGLDPTFLRIKGDSLKNHILGKMRHKITLR